MATKFFLRKPNARFTVIPKSFWLDATARGKSTLLRCILGEEELDGGTIVRHSKLNIGYLRQHDPFLPGETSLEFLMRDSGQPDWKCGEVAGEFELKASILTDRSANFRAVGKHE